MTSGASITASCRGGQAQGPGHHHHRRGGPAYRYRWQGGQALRSQPHPGATVQDVQPGQDLGFRAQGFENPTDGIDDFREQKRDRWVKPDELPRLAQAINEESNEVARHALWLYLLTGTRKYLNRWRPGGLD